VSSSRPPGGLSDSGQRPEQQGAERGGEALEERPRRDPDGLLERGGGAVRPHALLLRTTATVTAASSTTTPTATSATRPVAPPTTVASDPTPAATRTAWADAAQDREGEQPRPARAGAIPLLGTHAQQLVGLSLRNSPAAIRRASLIVR
jgi:hypothetical protein